MRGRNNNNNNNNNNQNRRGPNPLTRNYESNGPDVKIRGSAQQIAEKYSTLARDALTSGDRVMAENYLQHAEHYNRIIAAAQAQMPIQNVQPQQRNDEFDDEFDDEAAEGTQQPAQNGEQPQMGQSAAAQNDGNNGNGTNGNLGDAPQPVIEGMPAEVVLNQDAAGSENDEPQQRPNGHQNGNGDDGDGQPRRSRRRRGRGRFGEGRDEQSLDGDGDQGKERAEGAGGAPVAEAAKAEQPAPEATDAD
jgi:hypothetical protein